VARRARFVVPVDTCQFSPLQLHPATALRIGMTALARCIGEQLVEWRVLKTCHRTTVVIAGVRLDYLRPFGFFSAAEIEVDAGLVVRRGGRLVELDCRLGAADGEFARLTVLNRPVRISDTDALDAVPVDLEPDLLGRFQLDEHDPSPLRRPLRDRLSAVRSGELVGEGQLDFTVSRADCEIADQWQNVRLPDWLAAGRERLVFDGADARLKAGLRDPMSRLLAEYRKPMYLGDAGLLRTQAYAGESSVAFVHELHSVQPGINATQRPVCAVAVEDFPAEGTG
jgi:hypothetical protein